MIVLCDFHTLTLSWTEKYYKLVKSRDYNVNKPFSSTVSVLVHVVLTDSK